VRSSCGGQVNGEKVKFWDTKDKGQKPFSYQAGMGKVIRGWDDGVMTMTVGEVAEITMEGKYGYGAGGFPVRCARPTPQTNPS
jgi:peptidylprolyl isomerase